ncbi:transposase [Streptomyces sp. NPDC007901]|uniref:IS110 family transposase n=1 Tax=Streptomyces sp. NPDC007901 TaxID=3364785 RepID=UPI0036E5EC03
MPRASHAPDTTPALPTRPLAEPRSRRGAPAPRRDSEPSCRGRPVHQASAACRGQGKTAEKDAFAIADQARMRQDLGRLRQGDEIAVDLRTPPPVSTWSTTGPVRPLRSVRTRRPSGRPAPRGFSYSARC